MTLLSDSRRLRLVLKSEIGLFEAAAGKGIKSRSTSGYREAEVMS
jgi:hypothetical protein